MISVAQLFGGSPSLGLKKLREWNESDPHHFIQSAAAFLKSAKEDRFSRLVLYLLREREGDLGHLLFQSPILPANESIELAALASRIDPRLQGKWATSLARNLEHWAENDSVDEILRQIEVLARCIDSIRLARLLTELSKHSDPRIRSKAVLFSGQLIDSSNESRALQDPNARVRANALEAMWGRQDDQAIALFKKHSNQKGLRESVNSLLGLHQAGHLSARTQLMELADSSDTRLQLGAIWAMGQTKDPRLHIYLQTRLRNSSDPLRVSLLKAARNIKHTRDQIESHPRLKLNLKSYEDFGLGQIHITLLASDRNDRMLSVSKIHPVGILVRDGAHPVDSIRVEVSGSTLPIDVALLLPSTHSVSIGELKRLVETKQGEDRWCIQFSSNHPVRGNPYNAKIEFHSNLDKLFVIQLSKVRGNTDTVHASMDRLVTSFPVRESTRHIIALFDSAQPDSAPPASNLLEHFRSRQVTPHLLIRNSIQSSQSHEWKKFCHKLGGSFAELSSDRGIVPQLQNIARSLHSKIDLKCHVGRITGSREKNEHLNIELISDAGLGELTLDTSGNPLIDES